jgi:hypothetical protein
MKKFNVLNLIAAIGFGVLALPFLAFADNSGTPLVSLLGASNISKTYANVSISYDVNGATYEFGAQPEVVVRYTDLSTGQMQTTAPAGQYGSSNTSLFNLENLQPGDSYSFYAVMHFNGVDYTTQSQTFTTISNPSKNASSQTAQTTTSSTTTTKTSNSGITNPLTSAVNLFKNVGAAVSSAVATGGYVNQNGVVMSFSDLQANVREGDLVTFTVKYSNTNSYALKNAQIVVQLPEQYEFSSGDQDALYSPSQNEVSFYLDTLPAHAIGEKKFMARAVGAGSGEIQTIVTLSYNGGSLSTIDRDSYSGNDTSKSVLGASVFGAGFFPQTFVGWALVILFIIAAIIFARRYVTVPHPAEPQKTA